MSPFGKIPSSALFRMFLLGIFEFPTIGSERIRPSAGFIQRTHIGDICDGLYVCNSKHFLLTCYYPAKNPGHGTCACNGKFSVQVDYLKYRIGRMCLLLTNVNCNHLQHFQSNLTLIIQRVPGIFSKFLKKEEISIDDESVMSVDEMEDVEKEVKLLYDKEPITTRPPYETYFQEYLDKYAKDVEEFLLDSGTGSPCASGVCEGNGKCGTGVNAKHKESRIKRRFRNNAPTHMSATIQISLLLPICHQMYLY